MASTAAVEVLTKDETLSLREKHIGSSCKLWYRKKPVKIVSARGQYMYDEQGGRYLDCINNVAHVGHCHPEVVKAGAEQMTVLNTNSRFLHDSIVMLAKRLSDITPGDLSVCFMVNSGSEANDLALRLARTHTKAEDAIVLEHAYHGHTVAVMDLSPYKVKTGRGRPSWVHVAPCPDPFAGDYNIDTHPGQDLGKIYADEVKKVIDDMKSKGKGVAAFYAESLQSCAGQVIPPPGYLKHVYKHVRDAGGVCIADEVQVGFGRVGTHWWAFELQGVVPDIVTMGKPMGNGHPVAAVLTTPAVAASFANTGVEYFNTYGGNPVSCAIALSVIDVVEKEKLRENAIAVGGYLLQRLQVLKEKYELIGYIKGAGMFVGVDLVKNRKTKEPATAEAQHISSRLKDMMIFFSTDGPHQNVLKFKPPMCFTKENVDELVDKIEIILKEMQEDPDLISSSTANGSDKSAQKNGGQNGHNSHSTDGPSPAKKQRK